MAHRLAPRAETDLEDIWYYVAKESGSLEIANRLIDTLTDRFFMLAAFPYIGRARDDDFGPGCRSVAGWRRVSTTLRICANQARLRQTNSPPTAAIDVNRKSELAMRQPAEWVGDKEAANPCHYFQPNPTVMA
jgi:plasmid stabilization system protein ParE